MAQWAKTRGYNTLKYSGRYFVPDSPDARKDLSNNPNIVFLPKSVWIELEYYIARHWKKIKDDSLA